MNYFIKRDLNEYGPYSLSDLQKYIATGNILLTDLCRSEGLTDWVPVSQVIGNIPVPAAPQPAAPQPGAGTVYGGAAGVGVASYGTQGSYAAPVGSQYPPPPSLHWGVVLLLTFLTCGIFALVWLVVEVLWIKKVKPDTKSAMYLTIAVCLWLAMIGFGFYRGVIAASTGLASPGLQGLSLLLNLVYIVMHLLTVFTMKSDLEEHFNSAEPIGLSLSGVMTFFFAVFYFQFHFNRINEMKQRQMGGYPG
jgi:hypothetical protein